MQKDDFWTGLIKKIASLFFKSAGSKDGKAAKANKSDEVVRRDKGTVDDRRS